jgi:hypothetical protein
MRTRVGHPSWQEDFLDRLVETTKATGDPRLAAATLRRRKKTASFEHPQFQSVQCIFDTNRLSGNPNSQVIVVEGEARRGTEIDGRALRNEFTAAGINGDFQVNGGKVFAQSRWGYKRDAAFPVHDSREVQRTIEWVIAVLKVLFDHLERRLKFLTRVPSAVDTASSANYALALEKYLEDLLVGQWAWLPWAATLEYLSRQMPCGDHGNLDILARDKATGDFVVIELKKDQSDDEVVGQLSRYMGWVKKHRAATEGVKVRGIIVAHEATARLRSAASAFDNVDLYVYGVKIDLQAVSLPGR